MENLILLKSLGKSFCILLLKGSPKLKNGLSLLFDLVSISRSFWNKELNTKLSTSLFGTPLTLAMLSGSLAWYTVLVGCSNIFGSDIFTLNPFSIWVGWAAIGFTSPFITTFPVFDNILLEVFWVFWNSSTGLSPVLGAFCSTPFKLFITFVALAFKLSRSVFFSCSISPFSLSR